MSECIACGGSGRSSAGGVCVPCKGSGAARKSGTADVSAGIAQLSSESAEHYTPAPIVEAARAVLGGIDLDPASCPLAQDVVKATAWYGPGSPLGEDGLTEPWLGRVFLNPPGGRAQLTGCGTSSNAALWWGRLASSWEAGEVEAAIFVGFTLEILRSAQALDVLQPLGCPLCVPSSRIAFDTTDGGKRVESTQPTHANVIVYLPPAVGEGHVERFKDLFEPFGRCRA